VGDEQPEFAYDKIAEALNGENPLAEKLGSFDDPVWVESMADHAAYRSGKTDAVAEITVREAWELIDALVFQERLQRVTDDMWRDDKVTLA
jgi:hypothetical protein